MTGALATIDTTDDRNLRLEAGKNRAALVEYRSRLKDRADRISRMSDEDLARYATKAANERDLEALWALTEAYIVTKGRKKAQTSLATLDTYRVGIERLLKHWQGENLIRPSRDAGERYISDLQIGRHGDRPLEPGTIQVRLAAARALYRSLSWARATKENPFEHVTAPVDTTPPEAKRTAYTEEEIGELLWVSDDLGAVVILLGSDAGLRASEMIDLTWSDINYAAEKLTVRDGKGSKARNVEITPALIEALKDWKILKDRSLDSKRSQHVLPFTTTAAARLRLRTLCHLAGVKYLGLHSLRHSCGTWYANNAQRGLRDAQKQLGHSTITTTEVYAKMDRSTLKEAAQRRRTVLRRRARGDQPLA